jgi:hypothetical protein
MGFTTSESRRRARRSSSAQLPGPLDSEHSCYMDSPCWARPLIRFPRDISWIRLAGQLAKREGLRVIGSVGSDEKAEILMKEFGFDYVFNHKKKDTLEELKKFAPIQIYFDNVRAVSLYIGFIAEAGHRLISLIHPKGRWSDSGCFSSGGGFICEDHRVWTDQ